MSLVGIAQVGETFYVSGGLGSINPNSNVYIDSVYKYDPSAENLVQLEGVAVTGGRGQLPMLMAVRQTC